MLQRVQQYSVSAVKETSRIGAYVCVIMYTYKHGITLLYIFVLLYHVTFNLSTLKI